MNSTTTALLLTLLPATACAQQLDVLPLDESKPLTRIALGSCAKQNQPQPIWNTVVESNPDVFIFLGDNIYGDTRDMSVLKRKYGQLAAFDGFQRVIRACPILATWDDHDYGADDAGFEYPMKVESQQIFLDFFGEPTDSVRRKTPGIYDAKIIGPPGQRVQIILLDTRYFRGPLKLKPRKPGEKRGDRYPLFDLTSSGLNRGHPEWRFDRPNRNRIGTMQWGNNFGMIVLEWDRQDPRIRFQIIDEEGDITIQRKIRLGTLQPGVIP